MNKITISAIAVVAGLLALFLAKNSIQTTLFDRSKFLDCFEAEVISEYQMQSIRSGQQTAGIFESMLNLNFDQAPIKQSILLKSMG